MADIERNWKINIDTGAANDAVGKLSDTMAGLTKASDESGDAIKNLTRQTVDATAAQQRAREEAERLRRAQSEAAAVIQAFGKDSKEAAEAVERLKVQQEKATAAAKEANDALEKTAKAVEEAAQSADKKAVPALKRMSDQLTKAGKEAEKTASDIRTLEARIETMGVAAKGTGAMVASFMGNLAANAVTTLAGKLGDLGMHGLETAANFERLKTALTTTLGSTEAANKAFAELQAFAAATPYSLEEVTEGFLKLKNRGLDASARALQAYGNTASAMGKSLDDMIEAVADAASGENERLKEFGIVGSKAGDQVSYTFRGMTETVKFSSKEIEQHLIKLGELNFAGGMEAQSRTLGGMWSTMKDGFDQFIVSVMDSGITDALKSIMASFAGMGETGTLLSNILGTALGAAFQALAATVKVATTAVELFATAANFVLSPIGMAKDAVMSLADDAFASLAVEAEKAAAAQAETERSYRDTIATSDSLVAHMQRMIDLSGEYASSVLAEAQAQIEAAGAAERRAKSEDDLWRKLEARNAKAEEKAIEDAFFAANEMGPALPPGFEKPKRGGAKKKSKGPVESTNRDIDFWAGAGASIGADVEGMAAAFEAESALREEKIAGLDRELQALEAKGAVEAEQIDMIWYQVEVESEATRAREALIDQRLSAEMRLAQWQVKNAKTSEQREQAQTRLEAAEHAKRLRTLEKVSKDEAKEHARREKAVGAVVGSVSALGDGMVAAFERMAEGEKGAIASMISELLKGVAKKHAILAFAEAALAIGAAASYRYAAAAQHGAAAALHTGVAVAAGVGAYAAGQVASARQGGGDTSGAVPGGVGASPRGSGSSGSGGSKGDDLQSQEVPISHEALRRDNPSANRAGGGASVVFNGPVNLYGAGGKAEFIRDIRAEMDKQDRGGRRPRT